MKLYKNKITGKIAEFSDNTPVPSVYEPYDNKPCSNCSIVKDLKVEKTETQFDEVKEEKTTAKKKGKK
jgi:hypothetical protein